MKRITLDYSTYRKELNNASIEANREGVEDTLKDIFKFIKQPLNDGFEIWDCDSYENPLIRKLIEAINKLKENQKEE